MQTKIRLAIAALALSCAGQSLWAAPVSSATNTVTGLAFKLVDLDTTDGIAPSLSIDPSWSFVNLSLYPAEGNSLWQTVSGHVFTTASGSVVSSDGSLTAAKTSKGLSSSLSLDRNQVGVLANTQSLGVPDHSTYSLGSVSASADGYSWPLQWTLSPHTQLVITGTVKLSSSTDVSSLANLNLVTGLDGQLWTTSVETSSSVRAVLGHPLTSGGWNPGDVSSDTFKLEAASGQAVDQGGVHSAGYAATQSAQQSFNLHYENTSSEAVQGNFAISSTVSTRVLARAYPAIDPPIPTIPEPGTLVLMGLGLFALTRIRTPGSRTLRAA